MMYIFIFIMMYIFILIALSHNSLFHNFCGWQVENIPVLNLGEKI